MSNLSRPLGKFALKEKEESGKIKNGGGRLKYWESEVVEQD